MRLDRWDSDTLRQVARRILGPYDIPPHILHQMQAALPSIHLVSGSRMVVIMVMVVLLITNKDGYDKINRDDDNGDGDDEDSDVDEEYV